MTTGRIETFSLIAAILSLGYCIWAWVDADHYQRVEGRRFESTLKMLTAWSPARLVPQTADAVRDPAEPGEIVGRIEIPRLELAAMVAEGTDRRTLRRAIGHIAGTALPGEPGNVGLAGHRDAFFRGLSSLQTGDRVLLTTTDGVFEYRIQSMRVVEPDQTEVLAPSKTPVLTLVTCYPFWFVGPAPQRFIVRAEQVSPWRRS